MLALHGLSGAGRRKKISGVARCSHPDVRNLQIDQARAGRLPADISCRARRTNPSAGPGCIQARAFALGRYAARKAPFRIPGAASNAAHSQRDTAFPAAVARYFWRRLLGASGSVNSTNPCSMAGARYKVRKLLRSDSPSFSCKRARSNSREPNALSSAAT